MNSAPDFASRRRRRRRRRPALESIDRYRIAAPFASLIRSEEASGPITGAAFAALLRFVQHDVFGTHACECGIARGSLCLYCHNNINTFGPLEFLRTVHLCAILCACAAMSHSGFCYFYSYVYFPLSSLISRLASLPSYFVSFSRALHRQRRGDRAHCRRHHAVPL